MAKRFFIYCLFLFLCSNLTFAQYTNGGGTNQEIGIMAGPVFFQSDYGEAGVFENYYKNNGISIGVFYYVSAISDAKSSFSEYFKLRLEASYMKSTLNHYGKYVEPKYTNLFANQLRAMSGSVTAFNFGFQMEIYPFKTDDYNGDTFSPYVSFGSQLSNYTSVVKSSLGPIGNSATTPDKYLDGIKNESGLTGSLTTSIGARYLLDKSNALIIDARIQYYFTDWMDGLNPDSNKYPENTSNDWSTTINLGYVYYFD